MDFGVPPIGRLDPAAPGVRPAGVRRPPAPEAAFEVSLSHALDGPPPELSAEMEVAARAYDRLRDEGHELSFEVDPASGRLVVGVHDLEGNLLRTIPPSAVLEVAAGAPLP